MTQIQTADVHNRTVTMVSQEISDLAAVHSMPEKQRANILFAMMFHDQINP
jgi:hypothetical protein